MHIGMLKVPVQRSVIVPRSGDCARIESVRIDRRPCYWKLPAIQAAGPNPPDRIRLLQPQRRPIAKSRQANLADDPSVAKESDGFLE
jgi:hypothetical protein